MSKQAVQWAYDLDIPKQRGRSIASMKAVLLCLCWHIGPGGESCWPSLSSLQRWSGLNRRAVVAALKQLEELELIQIRKTPGKGNVYLVAVGYWLPSAPSAEDETAVPETEPVALDTPTSSPQAQNQAPSAPRIEVAEVGRESPRRNKSIGSQRQEIDSWLSEFNAAADRDRKAPALQIPEIKRAGILRWDKAGVDHREIASRAGVDIDVVRRIVAEDQEHAA